jgi:hypothetical protein
MPPAGDIPSSALLTFRLPESSSLDFVRVYVGTQSGTYSDSFSLFDVRTMEQISSAMEPKLAQILAQPGVYFIALTVVDTRGRESGFSNELRVDTRMGGVLSAGALRNLDPVSAGHPIAWADLCTGELPGLRA